MNVRLQRAATVAALERSNKPGTLVAQTRSYRAPGGLAGLPWPYRKLQATVERRTEGENEIK